MDYKTFTTRLTEGERSSGTQHPARSYYQDRHDGYTGEGWTDASATTQSRLDTVAAFTRDDIILHEPLDIEPTVLEDDDPRLTTEERARRLGTFDLDSTSAWSFTITPEEAALQLRQLRDRPPSTLAERVDWVSQHLDDPLATPEEAPDNGAWSMLCSYRPHDMRKDFYSLQRQVVGRQEQGDAEQAEIDEDLKKQIDLMNQFGGWRQREKQRAAEAAAE